MNHVAHCFLSYPDTGILFGNFIGDYVKGKAWQAYPPDVQQGILLHRSIDLFTDRHPATSRSVARLRPYAGRYTAPVLDVLYDHLLCRRWKEFSADLSFEAFADWAYKGLDAQSANMPPALSKRWPQMLAGRFLHGYQSREGLEWVLRQFSRRLTIPFEAPALAEFFFSEIDAFLADFDDFFPEMQAHVRL